MKYLFLLGCSLGLAAPAWAQDAFDGEVEAGPDERNPESTITVLATGNRIAVDQTGQSITVIGADEIAQVQGADLTRVLERLPGVSFSRSGGLGSLTSVSVRGASNDQLLVLIDGVRVADVATPAGSYDFGNLLSGGIGKIELLRGSNSVVWGSQAIGGVLAVTSRELNGAEARAEYGAHDTFDASAVAGLSGDRHAITISGGYTRTDGISAAAAGTEPDPYRQWRIGGRGHLALTGSLSATLTGRYASSKVDFDSFLLIDDPEYQTTREGSGRAGLVYETATLRLDGGYGQSDTRRAYIDPSCGTICDFATKGRSQRVDLTGHAALPGDFTLDFGGDSEWTRFETTFDLEQKARLSSGHALFGFHRDGLDLSAGVRFDDHSRFGGHWTFGANGSVHMAENWRLRASYGEGFKAPTLVQLYGFGGNVALRPERSKAYDLGIEMGSRGTGLHFALTGFLRQTQDLIVAPPPTYDNFNIGKARAAGFEAELGAELTDRLRAQAAYSYVQATNRTPGNVNFGRDLARRPRQTFTLNADWRTPLRDLTLGADLRVVSHSYDDAANSVRLGSHALVTLRASLPVSEAFELFGRIENLTDKQYRTVAGYGTYGRSAYFGVRARF